MSIRQGGYFNKKKKKQPTITKKGTEKEKKRHNGWWLTEVILFTGRQCEIPEDPDNAVLNRQTFGDYVFITVVCTEGLGKDLFLYHLGSYCTSATLVWTPPEIPDCVG